MLLRLTCLICCACLWGAPALAENLSTSCKSSEKAQAQLLDRVLTDVTTHWKQIFGNKNLKVHLSFTLWPNGNVSNIQVLQSNGDYSDKLKAIQAVKQAAPFRKLPIMCEPSTTIVLVFDAGRPEIKQY